MKTNTSLIINLICIALLFWVISFLAYEDLDFFNPWGSVPLQVLWKITLPILVVTIILSINVVISIFGKRNL